MSVNDDRITGAGERATPAVATSAAPIADPAPLGAAAFALTTFLLSADNAGWMTKATGGLPGWGTPWPTAASSSCWPPCGNSATRMSSAPPCSAATAASGSASGCGSFWSSVTRLRAPALKAAYLAQTPKDLGWILLAFAIFNTYMLLISTQVNPTVFTVLLLLEATEILLFDRLLHGQHGNAQGRRLRRHRHRAGRLVPLGGRGDQWPWGPDQDAGRQAAHQLARPARNLSSS